MDGEHGPNKTIKKLSDKAMTQCIGVWHGVAMDSLKYRHALPFYSLRADHPWIGLTAISGVARP
jgi:hypothetical protein